MAANRVLTSSPDFDDEVSAVERIVCHTPEDLVEEPQSQQDEEVTRQMSHSPEPDDDDDQDRTVCIKVEHAGFVRQLVLEKSEAFAVSWAAFSEKVKEVFRFPANVTVIASYRDLDGDSILIDSDLDLKYLLRLRAIPKLSITTEEPAGPPAPVRAATRKLSSLPGYVDPVDELATQVEAVHVLIDEKVSHLDNHPESMVVLDMVVDLVFADPDAMHEAIKTLDELAATTKIPIEEIFEAFNEKLKHHVPKPAELDEDHVANCSGITDACRHLHYDLPPTYTVAVAESDPKVVEEGEKSDKKEVYVKDEDDDDVFVDAPIAPEPPVSTANLTTAELQQLYKKQKKAAALAANNDINSQLSKKFTVQRKNYTIRQQQLDQKVSLEGKQQQQQVTPPVTPDRLTTGAASSTSSSKVYTSSTTPVASSSSSTKSNTTQNSTFAFSLKSALSRAKETHAQMHATVLSNNPWLTDAFKQANAFKDSAVAEIDKYEPARNLRLEAKSAIKFIGSAAGAALGLTADEQEVWKGKEKEYEEVVDRVMKMDVVGGGVERERVRELVAVYDGDVDRVVDAIINDRLNA
ncbi:hypothetical protein HDU79_011054 [Rhizoclosmatium sp. JEL0117]|nr:hypothetical protein HDU79_011054 [Rhizoclosmatium sp. JEL0117]